MLTPVALCCGACSRDLACPLPRPLPAISFRANPAPLAVYQSERYGTFSYIISGLTAGAAYTVNLHFTEDWGAMGEQSRRGLGAGRGGRRMVARHRHRELEQN